MFPPVFYQEGKRPPEFRRNAGRPAEQPQVERMAAMQIGIGFVIQVCGAS
jgi:hypothetical protein